MKNEASRSLTIAEWDFTYDRVVGISSFFNDKDPLFLSTKGRMKRINLRKAAVILKKSLAFGHGKYGRPHDEIVDKAMHWSETHQGSDYWRELYYGVRGPNEKDILYIYAVLLAIDQLALDGVT